MPIWVIPAGQPGGPTHEDVRAQAVPGSPAATGGGGPVFQAPMSSRAALVQEGFRGDISALQNLDAGAVRKIAEVGDDAAAIAAARARPDLFLDTSLGFGGAADRLVLLRQTASLQVSGQGRQTGTTVEGPPPVGAQTAGDVPPAGAGFGAIMAESQGESMLGSESEGMGFGLLPLVLLGVAAFFLLRRRGG